MESREVVVIGGGPGGAAVAAWLADAGHDVLLIERAALPRPKVCAEYTSPEAAVLLERLGALEAAERAGLRRLDGIVIHAPDGTTWRMVHGAEGAARPNLALPRDRLDAALVEHARSRGAEVWERVLVRRVLVEDGVARGVLARDQREGERRVAARLVIGADGVRSRVARDLGLARPLRWPRRLGLVARYQDVPAPDHAAALYLGAGTYAGLTPLGGGLATVSLVTALGPGPRRAGGLEPLFEALVACFPALRERLRGAHRLERPRGIGPLGQRTARPYAPGALLVGDAAGFFDPLTGDGIYLALRGAELAAETADAALRAGDCSATRLAPYQQQRHAAFGAKARLAWLLQLFICWPPLAGYALRRLRTRGALAQALCAALGDYGPAEPVLRPGYLAALLRP